MTKQGDGKGRQAGRVRFQRLARGHPRRPAARGRTRRGPGTEADQKQRDARARGTERKFPARRQVERLGLAPELDEHGAERRTACGLARRAKSARRIGCADQEKAAGIEPEGEEPRAVKPARFRIHEILPHPNQRPVTTRLQGQCQAKASRGHGIRKMLGGVDLVQRPAREPAAQARIERRRAERKEIGRRQRAPPLESRENVPRRRQISGR